MTSINFNEKELVSIVMGGAVGTSAVVVSMVHGTVISQTEKAVNLQLDNGATIWLPKAALTASGESFKLAKWFKPNEYQNRVLMNNRTFNGITAG